MIATLFALGTLWFWLLLAVSVISITALIENEYNFWADMVFVATILILYKLGCGSNLSGIGLWISQHWFYSILIFIGYLIAGTLYSLIKWALFVSDGRDKLIRQNNNYYASDWKPAYHKTRITHWMIYWPISGLWTLISNPIVKAFNRIFYKLEKVYQSISDKIMRDLIEKRKQF